MGGVSHVILEQVNNNLCLHLLASKKRKIMKVTNRILFPQGIAGVVVLWRTRELD